MYHRFTKKTHRDIETHLDEATTPEIHVSGREKSSTGVFLALMDRLLTEVDRLEVSFM